MSDSLRTTCPICGGARRYMYKWRSFDAYECDQCGVQAALPVPTAAELQEFYRAGTDSDKRMHRTDHRLNMVKKAFAHYLNEYQALTGKPPTRFADIGGGLGHYTRAALDAGLDACMIDFGSSPLGFAHTELNLGEHIVNGDVQRVSTLVEPESFDYALARHVIEHMRDPREFVTNVAAILKPGGLFQIETPDVRSPEQWGHPNVALAQYSVIRHSNPEFSPFKALKLAFSKSMSGINPPKHLWGFTGEGLSKLLQQQGFEVLREYHMPAGHAIFDPLYYDIYGLPSRSILGIPFYFYERAAMPFFRDRGMNLIIIARRL